MMPVHNKKTNIEFIELICAVAKVKGSLKESKFRLDIPKQMINGYKRKVQTN